MTVSLTAEDRFGIYDLYARYAWGLDTVDLEGYLSAFTPDGRYNDFRGHEALSENFRRLTNLPIWPGSQHYNGQLQFIEGGDGRCRVKAYSMIVFRHDGEVHFRYLGIYHDACVKVGDRWQFIERLWEAWDPDKLDTYAL